MTTLPRVAGDEIIGSTPLTHVGKILLAMALAALPGATVSAQTSLESTIVQAESGTFGADFMTGTDATLTPNVQYAFCSTNLINSQNPTNSNRVATYTVTFPTDGVYNLYVRLRVGVNGANDDSFFYANAFGIRNPAADNNWITANNFSGAGFTLPTDKVAGPGVAGIQVWKWVAFSTNDWGEGPVSFTVPSGALTQTFQIGGREDGLWFDKLAFGQQGVFFTVNDLDNGLPGTTTPPPPPFVPPGPAIATGKPKFLGGVSSPTQNLNFNAYFNQVTPENGGKWGSVEATRNVMTWGDLDTAYNLAKNNVVSGVPTPLPFRMHNLIWGNQQPAWIETLPTDQQRAEIEQWFAAVAARYPVIDFIDVVNEPLHDPPNSPGNGGGNYIEALGGAGASGWEWVLQSFRLARQYFPNTKLGINEYSVTNNQTDMLRYIDIINLLKTENLIDTVGVQGHAFSTTVPSSTTIANLDLLAATGVPIYVTELDIDGPTDEIQLAAYQRIFPAFWEHPGVRGITLWGYRPGHWRTAQGAYIVLANGAERPAMTWLQGYVASTALRPWIVTQPVPKTATVENNVSFTVAGGGTGPLTYQWRKDGTPISGNDSATTSTLSLTNITTADAGSYDAIVSNVAGSATSSAALLNVNKAVGTVTLSNLLQTYDGAPHAVSYVTSPPGRAVDLLYDGSSTPPTDAGSYAVTATINDANYVGSDSAVLTIAPAAVTITLSGLGATFDGSPHAVTATTEPADIPTLVTYDGSPVPPTNPGIYAVTAVVTNPNYTGSATDSLMIARPTAPVRPRPPRP